MKWLFAALILANLGFWMWASWFAHPGVSDLAPESRPQINAKAMRLLTESQVQLQSRRSRRAPTKVLTDIAPPKRCFVLGRYTQEALMQRSRTQLAELGLATVLRKEVDPYQIYRVYLGPQKTEKAALNLRKRLTRLGYKDHAVIREPALRYAVSMGVFAVKDNANVRIAKLRGHGLKPKMQTLQRQHNYYWLDIKSEEDLVSRLKDHAWGEDTIVVREQDCTND